MRLGTATSAGWTAAVLADLGSFLKDHASCERKASASAMSFVAHYPDRSELVRIALSATGGDTIVLKAPRRLRPHHLSHLVPRFQES